MLERFPTLRKVQALPPAPGKALVVIVPGPDSAQDYRRGEREPGVMEPRPAVSLSHLLNLRAAHTGFALPTPELADG